MRRRLALSAAAVTTMVVVAFLIPLAFLVRTLAVQRATDNGQIEAQTLAGDLVGSISNSLPNPDGTPLPNGLDQTNRGGLEARVRELNTSGSLHASVVLADGTSVGPPVTHVKALQAALQRRPDVAFTTDVGSGRAVVVPVSVVKGTTTSTRAVNVVYVLVPGSVLQKGVAGAWALLCALGIALIGLSVLLADRLARALVRPMRELRQVTHRLEQGDLTARVTPAGPAEVAGVGHAVNLLAARIGELVADAREAAADVSHRLRTPLTSLRLDAEGLEDPLERARLSADVDALEHAISQVIHEARQPKRIVGLRHCDLVATTRARAAFWAALAEVQLRPCTIDLPNLPIEVGATSTDLAAALDSLVNNVFRHTPEGTGFRIIGQRAADGGLLVVEDDGTGFAKGLLPARGKSTVGSTGLGLDIARRVAERCGGSLRLTSSSTGGARVELALGAAPVPEPDGIPVPPSTTGTKLRRADQDHDASAVPLADADLTAQEPLPSES